MTTPPTPARTLKPNLWARIKADLRPGPERWRHAIRVAAAGMLIIGVQMTLRFELLYPAMTALLILSESRGHGTPTRFLLSFVGATIGCASAVALMALFIQQPFFLLPIMWGYIIVVMYFMGASRYRGAFFAAGYPFIVAVYMSFFDKEHAEHITITVYKSVITGLACSSLVMMFLWPERPEVALRERLERGFLRSRATIAALIEAIGGRRPFDTADFVPESYRMRAPAMIELLDQAQTDLDFGDDERRELSRLIALDTRVAAAVAVTVDRLAPRGASASGNHENTLRTLEAELAAAEASLKSGVFATLERRPDFGTLLLRNLRGCLPRLFRKPLWPPEPAQLKHSVKCSSAIMICALFCITMNWSTGIGCVETVMLVVQATLGGTLLIGGLRLVGVVFGYILSVLVVIWIIPIITTIPGLLAVFGVLLVLVGYAMHGSPRVCVPAMQTMIVFDFALLQLTRPDDSLLPAMDFSLAVGMGVVVTFIIYRLLWPVHAARSVQPTIDAMVASAEVVARAASERRLTPRELDAAHLRFADQYAACMTANANAQLEAPQSPEECDRALGLIDSAWTRCQAILEALPTYRAIAPSRPA